MIIRLYSRRIKKYNSSVWKWSNWEDSKNSFNFNYTTTVSYIADTTSSIWYA